MQCNTRSAIHDRDGVRLRARCVVQTFGTTPHASLLLRRRGLA